MRIRKEADFKSMLKGDLSGGFFFFGEEDYLKQHYISLARNAAIGEDGFADLNVIRIDGEDYDPDKLSDIFAVPPMMSEKKFIELRGLDIDKMKSTEFDVLCEVLALLPEYGFNVFVLSVPFDSFDAGYLPKAPSPRLTALAGVITAVQFDLMPPGKLASWIKRHFNHEKVAADDALCSYLVDYCGRNMFVLKNEIDKLCAYVKSFGRDRLSIEDIKEAAIQSTEFGAFAFSNAIMQGDTETALSLLSLYKMEKKEPIIVMGEVTKVFSDMLFVKVLSDSGLTYLDISAALKGQKISDYKAKLYAKSVSKIPMEKMQHIISLCRDTDISLKNSGIGYVALERLICSV